MNSLDHASLARDIKTGNWDKVLNQLGPCELNQEIVFHLYEHIFLELLEKGEREVCSRLLHESSIFGHMKNVDTMSNVRFHRLESLLDHDSVPKDLFKGQTKSTRRDALQDLILGELSRSQTSRLLQVVEHALRFERQEGMIPPNASCVDLLTGQVRIRANIDSPIRSKKGEIKLPKGSFAECLLLFQDAKFLITGSSDGLIEVYEVESCLLASEAFPYQGRGEFMVHGTSVTALALSSDQMYLASGDREGEIRLWDIMSGRLLKSFKPAHSDAISSLQFSSNHDLLSTSLDKCARIYGIKSGRLLQEFNAPDAFVNTGMFFNDELQVVLGCSNGELLIFSREAGTLISKFTVQSEPHGTENPSPSIQEIKITQSYARVPSLSLIVCARSNVCCEIGSNGSLVMRYTSDEGDSFTSCEVSPGASFIYLASEKGKLYAFDRETGDLINVIKVCESGFTDIQHDRTKSLLVASSFNGTIHLFEK